MEIRWIIFFAAKDGEALYSQQKHPEGRSIMTPYTHLVVQTWHMGTLADHEALKLP